MAKIFKPRRALRSSVKSGSKRTLVLASGELMLVGKTAIGEGSKADLYLGDGVSQMQNLSPAMYGDTSEEDMTITDDTSTTASAALGNVTTGKTLGAILGSLKKAISLNAAAITTLNDDLYEQLNGRFIAKSITGITIGSKKYIKQNENKGFSGILIGVATGTSPFTDTWCFAAGSACKIAKTGTNNVYDLSYNTSENYYTVTIQQVNTLFCSITSKPVIISDTI